MILASERERELDYFHGKEQIEWGPKGNRKEGREQRVAGASRQAYRQGIKVGRG